MENIGDTGRIKFVRELFDRRDAVSDPSSNEGERRIMTRYGFFLATLLIVCAIRLDAQEKQSASLPPSPNNSLPAACKTPVAQTLSAGFTIACDKRVPTGTFLGAYLASATGGLDDCVRRCTADSKCVAFSLDNRDSAKAVCSLYGSIESQSAALNWILGIRIPDKPAAPTVDIDRLQKGTIDFSKLPDLSKALQDTTPDRAKLPDFSNIARAPSGLTHFDLNNTTISPGGSLTQYSSVFHSKTIAAITGNKSAADTGAWINIPGTTDLKNIVIDGTPLTVTPDMKTLQPVYFATDRTLTAGALTEASFTDSPTLQLSYGYTIVSIPLIHDIGKVERPKFKWYKLATETESDANSFRIKVIASLDRAAFVSQLNGDSDSLMLFIHGYNVPFTDAIFKAAQIAYDANFAGTVVVFSWPSAGALAKYEKDRESAEAAAPRLVELLQLISSDIGKKNVYVIAHSMGNEILVNALQQIALSKTPIAISELVMAAPDVDNNVYKSKADLIRSVAKNITLYASSTDKALLASGAITVGTRIGYVGPNGPSIFAGIDTIDVSAVGDDMLGLNHSTFSTSRTVLDDVGHILRSLSHLPPDLRTPTLRLMPDRTHVQYWLYPP